MSTLVLLSLNALAAPIERGVQAQIHPAGMDFVGDQVSGARFELGPMDFESTVDCFDPLVIEDFNVEVNIDRVTLSPGPGTLGIDVQLGTVRGTYWDVSGDTAWFDTCFDFSVLVEVIELRGGRLQGTLEASVVAGELHLDFVRPPVVSGELSSDVDWFPDDLVWSLVEDMVIGQVATGLEEEIPPLLEEYTVGTLPLGDIAGIPVSIDIDEVKSSAGGLYAAVDVDLGTDGDVGPVLNLDPIGDSHIALGITEGLAQDALDLTWQSGLLDPDSETTTALLGDLIAELGLGTDVEAELGVGAAPRVELSDGGLRLYLDQTTLEVRSGGELLLKLVADMAATLDVAIDVDTAVMGLSAHDVTLDVHELDADRVLSEDDSATNVEAFLEGWVAQAMSTSLRDIELVSNQFGGLGYVLRIDEVAAQERGLGVWATVFEEDDPAVDREPPDSEVTVDAASSAVVANFTGIDDREGALSFSWRVDGGGWSSWQTEPTATVALTPGPHDLEVRARDTWQNVDPTPAVATFDVADPDAPKAGACGCSGGGTLPLGGWLMLGGLVVLRRRG